MLKPCCTWFAVQNHNARDSSSQHPTSYGCKSLVSYDGKLFLLYISYIFMWCCCRTIGVPKSVDVPWIWRKHDTCQSIQQVDDALTYIIYILYSCFWWTSRCLWTQTVWYLPSEWFWIRNEHFSAKVSDKTQTLLLPKSLHIDCCHLLSVSWVH